MAILDCNVTNKAGKGVPLRLLFVTVEEMDEVVQAASVKYGAGFRVLRRDDNEPVSAETALDRIDEAAEDDGPGASWPKR